MSVIGSARASWRSADRIWLLWGLFAALNLGLMCVVPGLETIPFHFIWVSLTIQYGLRVLSNRTTTIVLLAVAATTATVILRNVYIGTENIAELTEVPLMTAMFIAMVWHAQRHHGALREVSRMANSKARLLEREREFVRNAAHELRTPITIARGHSELIQMYHDDAGLQQDIAVVLEELDRLGNLTARMVTLAAAEDPEFLHLEDVDILEVMHDISRRWTSTVPRQWSVRPEAAGAIRADRARLDVALDALIENAIAFTDEQDSVTVSSWRANGSALIAVTDSGKGIAPDALKRIFDRFTTTGRQAARRSTGGTGLGLPIVKAIIEAHGGSVDVSSTLGYGSTFTVRLPSSASPERSGLMPTATMRAAAVGG